MTDKMLVSRVDGLSALAQFSTDIDRLNAASARPSAYASSAYLSSFTGHNEIQQPGAGECLFLVHEGGKLVACVPMRQVKERLSPSALGPIQLSGTRLEFLVAAESEQLQILCAPADEARVASALVSHFCKNETNWGLLELVGQKPGNALHSAIHAVADSRFRARDIAVEPFTEVPLRWADLPSYYRSLSKHMRSNISRQARRLYAAGTTELVLAQGGTLCAAWFDAYCDLDARSWKAGTSSSMARSPKRLAFYRAVAAGQAGFEPSFIGIVLDGVLIAGLLIGSHPCADANKQGAWCLEMAYDQTRADLGPGQLLLLLAVGEAIGRGDKYLNFLQNFAYYKHRWGAELIDVVNVQLIRRHSMYAMRARLGELYRGWQALRATKTNEVPETLLTLEAPKIAVPPVATELPPQKKSPTTDLDLARRITAEAIAASGQNLRRFDRKQALAYLPFDLT